jgi:predicted lipoprotein
LVRFAALLMTLPLALPILAEDLAAAKAEPNLEKRSRLALNNADAAFKAAQDAYLKNGDAQLTSASLDEVAQSVGLAYESLRATGKNPSKSPKYFKLAEIRTRELLRQLGDFRERMSALDRDVVDGVRASIQKVHDELLAGIMSPKKK